MFSRRFRIHLCLFACAAASLFAQPDTLTIARSSLTFTYVKGGATPATQNVSVTDGTFLTFAVSNVFNTPWLAFKTGSNVAPSTLEIAVNPTGLDAGSYFSQLLISATNANASVLLPVRLTVLDAPSLIVTPATLTFNYRPGDPVPLSQPLYVTASGRQVSVSASAPGIPWLEVSPATFNTPANLTVIAHPEKLSPSNYAATITLSSGDAPSKTVQVVLNVVSAPVVDASGIRNLASFLPGPIAPGEVLSIKGSGFGGPSDLVARRDASGRLPTKLGDTEVFFGGIAAPLLLAGPTQLTVFVPYGIAGLGSTRMFVVNQGSASQPVTLPIVPANPGVFTFGSAGQGQIVAINPDNTFNFPDSPAARGSIVYFYLTGEGQTIPAGVDGLFAGGLPPLPALRVSVLIGGLPARIIYAGGVPGLAAGIAQVNVEIPRDAPIGPSIPIQVQVGPAKGQDGVTISIKSGRLMKSAAGFSRPNVPSTTHSPVRRHESGPHATHRRSQHTARLKSRPPAPVRVSAARWDHAARSQPVLAHLTPR